MVVGAGVVIACVVLMLAMPGVETVSYHVGWITLVVMHGVRPWTLGWAVVVMSAYAVVTGAIMLSRAVAGVIPYEECAEIPLMCVLVLLMVWHVNQRQDALATLAAARAHEQSQAERREQTVRLVSHEIRTTLTVAGGHVELAMIGPVGDVVRGDLEIAWDELMRLDRASQRLLRMIGVQESQAPVDIDIDDLMKDTMSRWANVAPPRSWELDSSVGVLRCTPARLRACLDTLIENALRHTHEGDVVRLVAQRSDGYAAVGVADSGPGLPEALTASLNLEGLSPPNDPDSTRTGLGLGIVREVAHEWGGRILAGRSAEGGALMMLIFPIAVSPTPPGSAREERPRQRVPVE